jgi:hypothetical protein
MQQGKPYFERGIKSQNLDINLTESYKPSLEKYITLS